MGQLLSKHIFPQTWGITTVRNKAETALTLAAHQLALSGVGVAWLPNSIAKQVIKGPISRHIPDAIDARIRERLNIVLPVEATQPNETGLPKTS